MSMGDISASTILNMTNRYGASGSDGVAASNTGSTNEAINEGGADTRSRVVRDGECGDRKTRKRKRQILFARPEDSPVKRINAHLDDCC